MTKKEEPTELEETDFGVDDEVVETEEQSKLEETEEATPSTLYTILGNQPLHKAEAIKITSAWVKNATTFSSTIDENNKSQLDSIQLPKFLRKAVPDGIDSWFPVQHSVLPFLLNEIEEPSVRSRDIAIAAPTGSGKTLCYIIPILAAVGRVSSDKLVAVVLAPVQTLVKQIEDEFKRWNKKEFAKVVALHGANDFEKEAKSIASEGPNVIVATPFRFVQHLTSAMPPPIDLSPLRFLVVDEADRMGSLMREEWLDIIEYYGNCQKRAITLVDIAESRNVPQKIILSATLSKDVEQLHLWNLFMPRLFAATASTSKEMNVRIDHVSGRLALPTSISHVLVVSDLKFHPLAVYHHITKLQYNRILVFVNELDASSRLSHVLKHLCADQYSVDYFTSNLYGKRRFAMLKRFNEKPNSILIASDVLARGVDLNEVDCVINYHLPKDDKLFVHRAGRTGRAGKSGSVISIGDKETKRIFTKMLKKTELFDAVREEALEENDFESYLDSYKKALEALKSAMADAKKGQNPTKRSGYEGKIKRKWKKNESSKDTNQHTGKKRKWVTE